MRQSPTDASDRNALRAGRIAIFGLLGVLASSAWFVALMPVSETGLLLYDASRFCFALAVVGILINLCFQSARQERTVAFFLGLMSSVACWTIGVPLARNRQQTIELIALGFPMILILLSGLGCGVAVWAARRQRFRRGEQPGRPSSVPRRFGVGTLMFVVLAASVLFATANRLAVPPPISIWAGGFLAAVGSLQVIMNNVPRAASVATGIALVPLTFAASWFVWDWNAHPVLASMVKTPADAVFVGTHFVVLGAVAGYVGGTLVAGLFLVIDLFASGRVRFDSAGTIEGDTLGLK